ncbi:hypothetical protein KWG64_06240 [Rahnella sp. PD12R]|uniref:hypothetical protein n=1 Tax=Rahnella sp. PD12R TaxID=2855688 RepID=UPI001C475730|nr:hypothetical protein [Rahnella sp. PD12R]MBV6817539.1 hypothetical protein [Rahnella sp. PD12R]
MNNDLEQFSEERLEGFINRLSAGNMRDAPKLFEMISLARIALAAKQAKPVGFVGKSYTMTYFMPPQDSGVEIDDLIYTTPPNQPVQSRCQICLALTQLWLVQRRPLSQTISRRMDGRWFRLSLLRKWLMRMF